MRIDIWRPRTRRRRSPATSGGYREPGGEARRIDRNSGIRDRADTDVYVLPAATGGFAENPEGPGVRGQPDGAERDGSILEVQGRSRCAVCAGRAGRGRSAERTHVSPGAQRGGIEGHQRREDAVHHYFGERDGDGRARAASSGATAGRRAELRDPGRIPGRGDARAGIAGRREDAELVWATGASAGRDCGDGAIFGACGKERVAALVGWITGRAEANLFDSR